MPRKEERESNHPNDPQSATDQKPNVSDYEIIKINDEEDDKKQLKIINSSMKIQMPNVSEYEIIKIEDEEDEKKPLKIFKGSMTIEMCKNKPTQNFHKLEIVKQCSMKLRDHHAPLSQTISAPVSPSLSLSFTPETSVGLSSQTRNIFNNSQSVVMVLPVNSTAPQILDSPTLCTLETIDKSKDLIRYKQIVNNEQRRTNEREDYEEQFANEPKEFVEKIYMKNSTDEDSNFARALIPWKRNENTDDSRVSKNQASLIPFVNNISSDITNTLEKDSLLQESKNKILNFGNEEEGISEIKPLLTERDSSEIGRKIAAVSEETEESCSVSIERNCVPKNMHSEEQNKKLDFDKEKAESENGDITIVFENNERPFSPVKKNTMKSSFLEEENEAEKIKSTAKCSGNTLKNLSSNEINSAGNKELSIVESQESRIDIDSSRNEEIAISQTEENAEDVISSRNEEISIPESMKQIKKVDALEKKNDSINLSQSAELLNNDSFDSIESFSPISQSPESSPEKDKDKSTKLDKSEKNANEGSSITNVIKNSVRIHLWKAQCISCKKRFSDRNELHKHATLSHPDVKIIFCDLCSDSFFTDRELTEHRSVHENRKMESRKTNAKDVSPSNEKLLKISENEEISSKHKEIRSESSPGNSEVLEKKPRGRPRKQILITNEPPMNFRNFSEVKDKNEDSAKKNVESVEMKKLVVPLKRLEGPLLEKYMRKLSKKPVINSGKRESLRSNKGKRKQSLDYLDTIDNQRKNIKKKIHWKQLRRARFAKKKENHSAASSESDSDEIIEKNEPSSKLSRDDEFGKYFKKINKSSTETTDSRGTDLEFVSKTYLYEMPEENLRSINSRNKKMKETIVKTVNSKINDSLMKNQTIIRKLPSRSSAASFLNMRKNRMIQNSENNKRKINGEDRERRFSSAKKIRENISVSNEHKIRNNSLMKSDAKIDEKSYKELKNFEELEEFEVLEEIELSEEFEEVEESDKKISPILRNSPKKTYLPSKRRFESTEKLKQEAKKAKLNPIKQNELCFMCKALLNLMKRITAQFESKNPRENTVQCPFCKLDFISMFYVEEHIAGNHLHCKNERPCKRAKNLVYADTKLDCETEIELSIKCSQCSMKFSNEEDLNDHITNDHEKSTPLKIISMTNIPNYLVDFSSFCLETVGDEKIEDALKDDEKNLSEKNIEIERTAEVNGNFSKNIREVTCWLCDLPFTKSWEYVKHMAEVHELLKPVEKKKISSPKLNPTEQIESDRKYLLKQLLSDDSMDGFEEVESSDIHEKSKGLTVEIVEENAEGSSSKRIVGRLSSSHSCNICFKEFNRAQDLLNHRISHNSNPSENEEIFCKSVECENQKFSDDLFIDPPIDPENFAVLNDKENNIIPGKTAEIKDSFINSKILNREFTKLEKIETKESREKMKNTETLKKSLNQSSADSKKSSKKNISSETEASQFHNEKRDALKELLDTENDLGKTDENIVNDKMPIECSKCNRKFPNREALNEHLFFLHDDSLKDTVLTDVLKTEGENEPHFYCEPCQQEFKMLQGYSRHRYKIHGDDSMVHICENCCKILTTVTMVNVHICTDVASYNCRTCNETFPTGMSLRLHNSEKHEETEEPNICYPCDKMFLTKSMLKRHEKAQHRFIRPYRSRSSSPVRMAIGDNFFNSEEETAPIFEESDEFSLFFDDEITKDFEKTESVENEKKVTMSSKDRRRSRSQECNNENLDILDLEKNSKFNNTMCIDEKEIHQCSLCDLYCLTISALENHKATIHSGIPKVCQLCRKFYVERKVIKHMIDEHIDPCETYSEKSSSMRNLKERDVEVFVKMLGIKRFVWLWEYHRIAQSTENFNCQSCDKNFSSNLDYKMHFFEHHDSMCMLCNIEFKSGEDAAKHKKEEHRSAECYLWFIDKTLSEVAGLKNIHELVERICFDLISQEKIESDECNEISVVDTNNEESSETEEINSEENTVDLEEKEEDESFIVVVTDEDLVKYNIGTEFPNIWGLASQISSTCENLTPTDVKEILEMHFEK